MMRRLLLSIALLGLCVLAIPQTTSAFNPFGGVKCDDTSIGKDANDNDITTNKSAACVDKKTSSDPNPLTGNDGLLAKITNIIAFVGGAAAIIMILVGALRYITSGSDVSTGSRTDTDVEGARHTIANAVIGLAVIVLARTLILFVLGKI